MEVLKRIFQGVPAAERELMTSTNVIKLYGITPPVMASA
jgi:hypothetical protein